MTILTGPEYIPPGAISQAVIFLHGLGSNGDDLLSLAPLLGKDLPQTVFLAPNAPYPVPFAQSGYQWFDLWDRTPHQIEQGARTSAPFIVDFIEETAKRFSLTPAKIALVGFSQGTMMALHVGLRLIDGLACIVGYSGAMIGIETLSAEKIEKLPPTLLVHGALDNVVPLALSQQAETIIQKAGGYIKFLQRPSLVHSIDDIGIAEGITFLKTAFAGGFDRG